MQMFRFAALVLMLGLVAQAVHAQTREKGPWWPHPIWGSQDQAGSSNWITPEKILESVKLVKTGQVYELGQVYERGMPLYGERTYSIFIPGSPTYSPSGRNKLIAHDELVVAEIGQVGTQFDGPGHIGKRLTMEDGSEQDVFYNGYTLEEMQHPYGLRKLGIENVKPIVTRGILVDVAGYKGVEVLDHSYEVTVADVRGALERQKMSEADIRPGDALLFRYGWAAHWRDPKTYNLNPPGVGLEVARWVVARKPAMVGSDTFTTEVIPNPDEGLANPVHQELVTKNGIWNLENMAFDELADDQVYEFLFVFTPIRFKGATGSPGRPIAIR